MTLLAMLPPSAIAACAQEDIRRRERNKARPQIDGDRFEQYAFDARDVRKASDAADLIERTKRRFTNDTATSMKCSFEIFEESHENLDAAAALAKARAAS
ncbi:hypothetical protein [Pyruvatibacter mobilis]|uniref:hypothetical protein n=1 Tax=Pyruvatibacter mobilis TaxID=1712261 RepID=UPI003D0D6131